MITSDVYYINYVAIVVVLILTVLVVSLCIWGFCLRVRREKRKTRFKKPRRRADKSNYKKLNQTVPEAEEQDSKAGFFDQSRIKSTSIVETVLSIVKRNLIVNDVHENSAEGSTMRGKVHKSSKKGKHKSKKSTSEKPDEKKKQRKISKLTCGASSISYSDEEIAEQYGRQEIVRGRIDDDAMAIGLQTDVASPERQTRIGRKNNYEESRKERHFDVVQEGARNRRPDQQLYSPPKAREGQNIKRNNASQKSSSATICSQSFQEKYSSGEKLEGLTENKVDGLSCLGECTQGKENSQYLEKRDSWEVHYGCKDEGINCRPRPNRNIDDKWPYDRHSTKSNENLGTDPNPNNYKHQISVESGLEENATGVLYRSGSKDENERIVNENGDMKLEKSEIGWFDEQNANHPQLLMEVDSDKSLPAHYYENVDQVLLVSPAATVESISIPFLIDEYAAKEWRGGTTAAAKIRKGYSKVKDETGLICIRQVRGDNYCALRAVLFKVLSSGVDILSGISSDVDIIELPRLLLAGNHPWLTKWNFANRLRLLSNSVEDTLSSCLHFLADIVRKSTSCYKDPERCKMILNVMNRSEEDEVKMFEAVKFLMLFTSIQLYNEMKTQESFEFLGTLLFARDTSQNPKSFMTNHLNCVGDTGGLDQLEMMLLGRTLNVVIKVFRLHKVDEEDFAVEFPDDLQDPEGDAILVAEDDRHYNVLSEEE